MVIFNWVTIEGILFMDDWWDIFKKVKCHPCKTINEMKKKKK